MSCFSTSIVGKKGILKPHFFQEILPTEYQIRSAMDDPESFKCVFDLCPIVKYRKKRSFRPKRTKSACREENTGLEALSSGLTLSPLVISKRKRSEGCKRSTVIRASLFPNSEEINGANELGSSIEKLACNEIQECTQYADLCPRTNISVFDEIRVGQPYEGLWSRTNKLFCNESQECQQPEHMWSRTDKAAEIQECSEDLFPRTEVSTRLESLVASLIPKLQNIRISDARAHKRMLAISKKKTTNNAGQPVLWNPFDPVTLKKMLAVSKKKTTSSAGQLVLWTPLRLHKVKHKPSSGKIVSYKGKDKPLRAKLPKVDIDTESLRVWNLLIENEGEIDEDLDKEKETWWEEQRKIFQGRAASFIARMRLVLGDRRFSQWKGSVVDSVVGVYLTQNVSDHLSSNAFMLLASAFPPQNKQETTTPQGQESVIIEGMQDSFEREVSADEKETGCAGSSQSPMSTCISSVDELYFVDDRNKSECLSTSYSHLPQVGDCINERWHGTREEKDLGAEDICGSQAAVTSCFSEVITSAIGTREEKDPGAEDICGSQAAVTSCSSEVITSAIGTREEKDPGAEDICGSQAKVTFCSPEVMTSDKSGNLGNEAVNLPEMMSRKKDEFQKKENDWDELRKTHSTGKYSGLTERSRDSVNWEAIRNADIEKIVEPIKCRGQSNVLGAKIKKFLNRLVEDHGSIDLEWLRDVPPDKVKEYLMSIHGIGPKSVDCVRLLTLRHVAFPVDINVARIAVRLGWVPLQPLPDDIQMHLLERYPMESSIQKYLWPRLCKLDLLTLYELHYHMITFGKVFCTKRSPNCNACPMRAECRHFASAFASARLRLSGPQKKEVANFKQSVRVDEVPNMCTSSPALSVSSRSFLESRFQTQDSEPIIEMPTSPEQRPIKLLERDIEDFPYEVEHEQEIPTIQLNTGEFRENVLSFINNSNAREFQENVLNFIDEISTLHRDEEVSRALVLLNPKYASVPARKLKVESRLRTEHLVYELPDSHPLLSGFEEREPDDPSPYLLSICRTEQHAAEICPGSTSYDQNNRIVYGTILIPCRTANRGSFPLNGTYFQVNEVFADQESSENPIPVSRSSIWNLRQKVLYCGTSVKTILKGLTTEDIQYCFWRGFICIRGYDRILRAPGPLHDRFYSGSKGVN